MNKGNKKVKDNTIIYMIVGAAVGAIVTLIFFEYYWGLLGIGVGLVLGVLVSTFVDYRNAQFQKEELELAAKLAKKTSNKVTKKIVKKTPAKKTTKKATKKVEK